MATSTPQKATARMVVLLRPSEKQRVQRLARKERVSSAEIVRRSLSAYDVASENNLTPELIAELNLALDTALASVRADLETINRNRAEIESMRVARS